MSKSRFEMIIGMRVTDEASYQRYRDHMTPLLESMGAWFRYDMRISELLKGQADEPFNRLFIMSFPDKGTQERFFGDERYLAIRREYFQGAVSSFCQIAHYDWPA